MSQFQEKQRKTQEEEQERQSTTPRKRNQSKEPDKYFEKYAKILGGDSGVDAAKVTKTNAAYGMGKYI